MYNTFYPDFISIKNLCTYEPIYKSLLIFARTLLTSPSTALASFLSLGALTISTSFCMAIFLTYLVAVLTITLAMSLTHVR